MQLEDYFDFLAADDIRLKDTRIGIETVLYDYIHGCQSPEEIAQTYPGLTLEQVYATVLYYLHQPDTVRNYLQHWLDHSLQAEQRQDQNPSSLIQHLIQLKASRQAA
ncbi:DUF433 domain-containing protein [Nodosilinea sp. LEGE 07088]|uniref:DUF433 domain-containing protein n=1 Tax=Nodosilinea sp. LEGE 07088 TaxID=2777968 RepID=UPI00187F59B5|nr:DUF433 domain-containing protein [Nodosilinea sp. LEGE 07088]MBE9137049.1 DUF433 domain-containing protein [Nodosilinea sp. LEGE 07088]